MVTQLQNQDPLDPMKNEELTMQLATLSQLQSTQEISTKFSSLLQNFELTEGGKLIGRVVDFIPDSLGERVSGLVSGATVKDGMVTLTVGPYSVKLEDVLAVKPYTGSSSSSTETTNQLIGDVNSDNVVDDQDRQILLDNFGLTTGAVWAQGDLNGDGAVNYTDYNLLTEHYGESNEEEAASTVGDLNGDGKVDSLDLALMMESISQAGSTDDTSDTSTDTQDAQDSQ
jgi:flagellar basal-body rod modification protein FlgD